MARNLYGSINVTKLLKELNNGHSGFIKNKNQEILANVSIWINDEPNQFKQIGSMNITSSKEKRATEPKVYIANFKEGEVSTPVQQGDIPQINTDHIPMMQANTTEGTPGYAAPGPVNTGSDDDLPF